jgi:hypothetical protein
MAQENKSMKSVERKTTHRRSNDAAGHPVRFEGSRNTTPDRQHQVRIEALLRSPRQFNDLYERQSI